MKIVYFCVD